MSATEAKEPTFEEAFGALEGIVRKLESGDANLDESLKLFEEGVRLARLCASKLDAAEGKIRTLLEGPDGALVLCDEQDGTATS